MKVSLMKSQLAEMGCDAATIDAAIQQGIASGKLEVDTADAVVDDAKLKSLLKSLNDLKVNTSFWEDEDPAPESKPAAAPEGTPAVVTKLAKSMQKQAEAFHTANETQAALTAELVKSLGNIGSALARLESRIAETEKAAEKEELAAEPEKAPMRKSKSEDAPAGPRGAVVPDPRANPSGDPELTYEYLETHITNHLFKSAQAKDNDGVAAARMASGHLSAGVPWQTIAETYDFIPVPKGA